MNDAASTIAELRAVLTRFITEREWQRYHDAKNLAMSIAIEAGELMEHFQWVRNDELDALRTDAARMGEIESELADVLAYTLALSGVLGIDLARAFEAKMRRNADKYPADEFRGRYRKPSSP